MNRKQSVDPAASVEGDYLHTVCELGLTREARAPRSVPSETSKEHVWPNALCWIVEECVTFRDKQTGFIAVAVMFHATLAWKSARRARH